MAAAKRQHEDEEEENEDDEVECRGGGNNRKGKNKNKKLKSYFVIPKKVCYSYVFAAIVGCVLVGLVVHFLTVRGMGGDRSEKLAEKKGVEEGKEPGSVVDVRLPRHLDPEHYLLQLVPFLNNFTVRGYAEISLRCNNKEGEKGARFKNVTLHAADLTIDEETVVVMEKGTGKTLKISDQVYDKSKEFHVIHLVEELEAGKVYLVKINFTALLSDGLKGFYRSVYKDEQGNNRTIATTQFQPTDARRAFPCLDEPGLKAKFEVSLGRTRNMTSISNMPVRDEGAPMKGSSEYVWDHYEASVPMSTYLVAFVVSDFAFKTSDPVVRKSNDNSNNNVTFRVWSRRNALDQIEFASGIGANILSYFEEYFGVSYPLPKQDMIAIPDFSAGAMENWGLITYRETALLFKPGVSSASNKQRIAVTISHELAHQWFGNLVTPTWWDDLWLNEGFATYVSYFGVDSVLPEMRILDWFIRNLQAAMSLDALESSHPISVPVNHPDEINEIFDEISYSKGATIIRMMERFLTIGSLRKGLTNYLNAFKYKAATQDDLWHYLTEQAHRDKVLPQDLTVKTIMDTWTLQMGYPVITVERDYEEDTAVLSQERFLYDKSDMQQPAKKDQHNYQWWVPITHTTPGRSNFNNTHNDIWLKPDEGKRKISGMPERDVPLIVNVQVSGYYRVNYDVRNWELIVDQLREADHLDVSTLNRAQLFDDAFHLASAGLLDFKVALGLTGYLRKEKEYTVWASVLGAMGDLEEMFKYTPAFEEFKKYMKGLLLPLIRLLGYDPRSSDNHHDVFLRVDATAWSCSLDMDECTDRARESFRKWLEQKDPEGEGANTINADIRRPIYCNAIRNGGAKEWDFAWNRFLKSNVAAEKSALLVALGCSNDTSVLERYVKMIVDPESGIRQQDVRTVIDSVASNHVGRDLAFHFVRDQWKEMLKLFGGSSFTNAGLLNSVMQNRNTRKEVDELIRFQEENKETLSSAERTVEQSIEKGEKNIKWMERNYETIFAWLKEQNNRS